MSETQMQEFACEIALAMIENGMDPGEAADQSVEIVKYIVASVATEDERKTWGYGWVVELGDDGLWKATVRNHPGVPRKFTTMDEAIAYAESQSIKVEEVTFGSCTCGRVVSTNEDEIPPAPQSRPAETKASGPQANHDAEPAKTNTGGPYDKIEAAGPNWCIEQVTKGCWDVWIDGERVRPAFLSFENARSYVRILLGRRNQTSKPQPVAYCIQCADDDPKVHSLSFDKAALGKIVTRHGGKVVPLYLGRGES